MKEKLANLIKGVALAILYILVFLTSQIILITVAMMVVAFMGGDIISTTLNHTGIISLFSAILTLCVCIISFYLRKKNISKIIRTKNTTFLDVLFAFAMAIGMRLLTSAYILWAQGVDVLNDAIEGAQSGFDVEFMSGFDIIFLLVAVCIIAPAFEEVLFRCIVFEELRGGVGAFLAIILQGVAFGIVHMNLAQSIFTAVIGIILGIVYYKTKNVVITVLVHLFFNCSVMIEIKNPDVIPQTVLVGSLMTIISLIMFFVLHRRKRIE